MKFFDLSNLKSVELRHGLKPTRPFEVKVSKTTKPKNKVDTVVISEPKVAIEFQSE